MTIYSQKGSIVHERKIRIMEEDILQELQQVIYSGDAQAAKIATEKALSLGYSTHSIIDKAIMPSMKEMGNQLHNGDIFIPEVLMASRAIHASMYVLKPILSHYSGGRRRGVVVIGTVAGDLHDIGKNLVAMVLRSRGFTVIDLGIDVTKEEFLDAVCRHRTDILALSALLTTTIPELKNVIDYITEAGVRPQVSIMVGGAPVTAKYAKEIKADVYTNDMFEASEAAMELINRKISKYSLT